VSIEPPPDLELSCLGVSAARVGGEAAPREVLWRTHFALLAHLALSPDRARARSHLIGLLWPEKPEEHARRSLNEAVRRLQTVLGETRLITDGDTLRLAADGLTVDVTARDALHVTIMQDRRVSRLMSFDRGFDRFAWLERLGG
jgi:DNA-binding SARP family transcriptional activator